KLIQAPGKGGTTSLEKTEVTTNDDGIAGTSITLGDKPGKYRVTAFVPGARGSPIVFTIHTHKHLWLFFLLISLLGGLAVFLFGMTYMSDNLQKLGGHKFVSIVEKATSNRFKALAVGTMVTAVIQSSSATTVMVVGLINSGLMHFGQSIGIILGANIGTTITAQIVAFKLTDYALWFVLLGFLISSIGSSKKKKLLGHSILGFGLLFFGMKLMGDVTQPLRTYQPFIDLLLNLENPIIGVIVGALFTTLIQSSSAATGVYIALSFQGLMTLNAAIPLIFGANIGTCTTALMASIGASREAKRAALAHILFNGFKVLCFLPFIPWYRDLIYQISPHPSGMLEPAQMTMEQISTFVPRMIANAHSIAKIIAVGIALPFTGYLAKLCDLILPRTENEMTIQPKYLNKDILRYPEMALTATRKEVIRMGGYAIGMLETVMEVLKSRKMELLDGIVLEDENIDILYKEIRPYLARITQEELDREESIRETEIIIVAEEFENIGDVISKSLISTLNKCVEYDLWFSEGDWVHIVDFHEKIRKNLVDVREAFRNDNLELAREIVASREAMSIYYKSLHIAHLQKHRSGITQTIEMSSRYLNLIADFRQIHTLITDIGQAIVDYRTAGKED
ncbi:MAG: Na/Pi symporter, partial [Candidatus Auribacterota bacterium]|nr:Na/Pi symporter [Candidatus Auribacterota bacterium]